MGLLKEAARDGRLLLFGCGPPLSAITAIFPIFAAFSASPLVFSSIIFLYFFLPIFLWAYYLCPKAYRNVVILLGSCAFYAWESPRFIFVILGTTFLDFHFVKWMDASGSEKNRKIWLVLSLAMNLGLLFYFKYCNFFIENFNHLLSAAGMTQLKWLEVLLPIGISFYTFESVTYVVDVYRRVHKPLQNFWDYQVYIILFPKLIAGPIIRYHEISDQIRNRIETPELRLLGLYRFMVGLGMKVLIANVMAAYAADIYGKNPDELGQVAAWIGALAYTFQIYFDFAGYSNMAIGLGMMMGFRFPENFNSPYSSQSITEFWRRWHITLGAWMRNYLYIPLGGNKVDSALRLYFNLWLVFLASGFWHGAAWAFLFWGAYHGLFLVLERAFLARLLQKIPALLRICYTFFVVLIGWVFFNLEDFGKALKLIGTMFVGNHSGGYIYTPVVDFMMLFYFALACVFSFWAAFPLGQRLQSRFFDSPHFSLKAHYLFALLSFLLLVLSTSKIIGSEFNPFIYFRF